MEGTGAARGGRLGLGWRGWGKSARNGRGGGRPSAEAGGRGGAPSARSRGGQSQDAVASRGAMRSPHDAPPYTPAQCRPTQAPQRRMRADCLFPPPGTPHGPTTQVSRAAVCPGAARLGRAVRNAAHGHLGNAALMVTSGVCRGRENGPCTAPTDRGGPSLPRRDGCGQSH